MKKQVSDSSTENTARGFALRLLLAVISAVCVVSFQNCGADFAVMDNQQLLASLGNTACTGDLKTDFSTTYYPFFKTSCASCHNTSAPVNFAQPSLDASFMEFEKTTTEKIRQYAINPNHGSGAGGPKNEAAITAAAEGYAACKNTPAPVSGGTITARTNPVVVTATATAALRSIALTTQLQLGSGNFAGAKFHFQVRTELVGTMQVYYIIKPSLQTVTNGVVIKGIHIMVNGKPITTATTFISVDKTFNPNTVALAGQVPNGNLSLGTAIFEVPGSVVATDTVQFEFEILKVQ